LAGGKGKSSGRHGLSLTKLATETHLHYPIFLFAIFLVFVLAAPEVSASNNSKDVTTTIMVAKIKRSYTIHLPKGLASEAPLVLVLHGFLAGRSYVCWDTAMSKYADENGFIVVYPKGHGLSWNAGDCCGKAAKEQTDDVAFVRALVNEMEMRYKIDRRKVFACGFSNGAMMCYRLAQELPDIFAAVAIVEGSLRSLNKPAKGPISVLIIHGDKDSVFPYDGKVGHWLGYKVRTPAIEDTVQYWIATDQCTAVPIIEKTSAFEKQTYSQGKEGTQVCLYKVKANGHFWPGGRESKFFRRAKRPGMSASQTICQFFLKNGKTASTAWQN